MILVQSEALKIWLVWVISQGFEGCIQVRNQPSIGIDSDLVADFDPPSSRVTAEIPNCRSMDIWSTVYGIEYLQIDQAKNHPKGGSKSKMIFGTSRFTSHLFRYVLLVWFFSSTGWSEGNHVTRQGIWFRDLNLNWCWESYLRIASSSELLTDGMWISPSHWIPMPSNTPIRK